MNQTKLSKMKKLICSAIFAAFCLSAMAQTPVNLKLNLENGKVYKIKNNNKQNMQISVSGQQIAMEVNTRATYSCKVLQQANDVIDFEFQFDSISAKTSSVMGTQETNSAKPGNTSQEKIMSKLCAYKLIAKISTAGKFIGFVNYGQYKDNVMFVLDSIPASQRDDARIVADALLKESVLRSMVEPMFAYLPEKAVKVSDTWETTYFNISSISSMVLLNTYTLKSVDNQQAIVSGTTEMESMPMKEPAAMSLENLKGTSTSESSIDLKTGLIVKSTQKGHSEGVMKANEQEMSLKMDFQSEISMSF
jgi:hypothetical protein